MFSVRLFFWFRCLFSFRLFFWCRFLCLVFFGVRCFLFTGWSLIFGTYDHISITNVLSNFDRLVLGGGGFGLFGGFFVVGCDGDFVFFVVDVLMFVMGIVMLFHNIVFLVMGVIMLVVGIFFLVSDTINIIMLIINVIMFVVRIFLVFLFYNSFLKCSIRLR